MICDTKKQERGTMFRYEDEKLNRKMKGSHILLTPATCKCNKQSDIRCPVCDYGLAICSVCGKAENELDSECEKGEQ